MARAFDKDILRSITHSWGRFIAIFGIVALGVGFYAGLRMTAPDMQLAADKFYDDAHLMDLRVVSTMGLTQEDMDALRDVEGVDQVMPAYQADAMGLYGGETSTFRIHSLVAAAAESEALPDGAIASEADDYLNRLVLLEGRWPERPDECVVLGDVIMKAPIELGQVITMTQGTGNLDDTLAQREFTIVGTVRAAYYTGSATLGATTIGSGGIDQALYVPEGAFAEGYPFTEAFITVSGAAPLNAAGGEYGAVVDQVRQRLEAIAGEREQARLDQLRADAQAQLDEARADFERERSQAESRLQEARGQLAASQGELDAKGQELASGRADYERAEKSLAAEREKAEGALAAAEAQIEANAATLATQETQLGQQKAQLEAQEKALAAQEAALVQQEGTLPSAQLAAQKAALAKQRAALEQAKGQVAAAEKSLAAAKKQLAGARESLKGERAQAQGSLAEGQRQLDEAQATLDAGEAALADGRSQLTAAQGAYDESRAQADREFADAEAELARAQADIDAIERPEWLVMDRTKVYGLESFRQDAQRVDSIAQVFPFIFFLVAALVALTTMTRMVDEERLFIGTCKALGYGRARIASKYLAYAGVASVAGSVAGIAALSFTLPAVIMHAYAIMYVVPVAALALDWPIVLLSAGLGVGITLAATGAAVARTLRETPAALMLPPAPKAGKRILLERVRPLWNRLSFLWKVTMRNIFRYKKRLVMTVVGIAGCTALLLTGFGLSDSINDIIDKHFGRIVAYTVAVTQDEDAPSAEQEALEQAFRDKGGNGPTARIMRSALLAVGPDTDQAVQVIVPQDPAAFQELWRLQNRQSGQALELQGEGAIVTEKLAALLGVQPGDELLLSRKDSLGNATGQPVGVPVAAVAENYVDNFAFLTPQAYEAAFGEAPIFATTLGTVPEDESVRAAFNEAAQAVASVSTVEYNDETIESYRTSLRSVNMVVVVLIIAAAALAFIVLYNLTNINITERVREIATLKVLGFTRGEVQSYIFRETIILTVLGALLGLVLGVFLEAFVVQTAEVDLVMFGRDIHPASFLWAFLLTLGFAALVMLAMRRKLRAVSMVESLKSNE